MEVLMMTGTYAGEIRDIKPVYAREMIADGRALDPNVPRVPVRQAAPAVQSQPQGVAVIVERLLSSPRMLALPAPGKRAKGHGKKR